MQQSKYFARSLIKKIEQRILASTESNTDKPIRESYKPTFRPRTTTQEIQKAIDLAG